MGGGTIFITGDGTLCGCEELIMVVLWDVMLL